LLQLPFSRSFSRFASSTINPPNCLRHRYFRTAITAAATSHHQEATIHLNHLTLDEARNVRTEKYSDIGNLFGCPQPLYWICGYNCVESLLPRWSPQKRP
jgi:hypothetical protein